MKTKEKQLNENKVELYILMIFLFVIFFGGAIYLVNVNNTDWNDYWFDRFKDGKCQKICEEKGMELGMQSPSYCQCLFNSREIIATDGTPLTDYDYINVPRPYSFRDYMQLIFGK